MTNSKPVILLFQPDSHVGPLADGDDRAAHLGANGFEVRRCAELFQLHQSILQNPASLDYSVMALLDGSFSDNCTGAASLRAQHPDVGIVALVSSSTQDQLVQILRSGADSYCLKSASDDLLLAILFRLLFRVNRVCDGSEPRQGSPTHGSWELDEQAWVLVDPAGIRVPLTTGERAFLLTLFNAPDLRAEHADLIAAVDACCAVPSRATSQVRLGVLVSRMRLKFRQHKTNLPLKSVHRWGYMFVR